MGGPVLGSSRVPIRGPVGPESSSFASPDASLPAALSDLPHAASLHSQSDALTNGSNLKEMLLRNSHKMNAKNCKGVRKGGARRLLS